MFASVVLRGMLAGLDGVLLGGQAEGVPAHRMQHVEAAGAAVAGEDVRGGVTLRMPDVQARAAGIGEHVQDVMLGRNCPRSGPRLPARAAGERVPVRQDFAGVPGAKCLLLRPNRSAIWARSE